MPTFCRHNRLIQACPICSRERSIELRPVISPSAPRTSQPRPASPQQQRGGSSRSTSSTGQRAGVKVRRLTRGADDGFHSPLVPGLKASTEARRLAEEIAFGAARLLRLAEDPPGLYRDVADASADVEERTWLAFQIAYVCPLDGEDPFSAIRRARTPWSPPREPDLDGVELGPRTAHDPARGARTFEAYRAWVRRAGSQAAAFTGDPAWAPERRFARAFERMALPGLHRDARFDLLVTLGRLGVYELRAGSLQLGGPDTVTLAAKRVLGIGDTLLLERRAVDLAEACGLPLETLDVGLYNWERGERAALGVDSSAAPDEPALASALAALGL